MSAKKIYHLRISVFVKPALQIGEERGEEKMQWYDFK